jgi:hypothetical protein
VRSIEEIIALINFLVAKESAPAPAAAPAAKKP